MKRSFIFTKHLTLVLLLIVGTYGHSLMASPCPGASGDIPQDNTLTFKNTGTGSMTITSIYFTGSPITLAAGASGNLTCRGGGSPTEFFYSGGTAVQVTSTDNGGTYYAATLSGGFITIPPEVLQENYWGTESPQKTYSSGCTGITYKLGAGAYQDILLAANTYYDFTWNSTAGTTTNGISGYKASIVSGGTGSSGITSFQFNTMSGWYSGSTATTIRVLAKRTNGAWDCNRWATFTIATSQPIGPTGGTKTPNLTTICTGTGVSYSSPTAGTRGEGCTDDYIWLINGVSQGAYTLGNSVGSTATAGQVITIQGRRANCTGSGCTATAYTTLATWSVVAQPSAPSGGTKSPNLTNICAGTSVSFSSPTAGTGGFGCSDDYIWLINGVSQGAYTLGSSVGSGATSGQVIKIQGRRSGCTALAGCTGTSYVDLATWTVNAQPSGPTGGTKTPNLTNICAGTGVSFSSPTAGTGGFGCSDDYIWLIDGVSQGAYTLGSSVGSGATSGQVIKIQGRRSGCTALAGCTGTSYVDLATWTVNAQPGAPSGGTKTPNLTNICAGTGVSYSSPTAGTGGFGCSDDYIWLINGVSQGAYTLGSTVGTGATAGQVISIQGRRANCTSGAGCTGTSYTTLASWTVVAAPSATPVSTIFTCDGTASMQANSISGGTSITWQYVSGPTSTGTSSANPLLVTFSSPGTVVYNLLGSNATCSNVNLGTVNLVMPTTSSATLATTNSCGYCVVTDGNSRLFYNSTGELIAKIVDDGSVTPAQLDLTEVCVRMDGSVQYVTDNLGYQQPYLQRQFTIKPVNNTNSTVTLYFTNAELVALQTAANSTVYQFSGYDLGISKFPGGGNGTFSPPTSLSGVGFYGNFGSYNSDHQVEFSVNSFSTFYIHPVLFPFAVLPVELTSFKGWNQDVVNKLEWVTASEENTSRFEVEKSVNAATWENIGSKPAAGNSSQTIIYNLTDNNPVVGNNYYRLKIFDIDEAFTYSKVINIPVNDAVLDGIVNVYPNPTKGNFNIEIQATSSYDTRLLVYDIIGKKVFEKPAIISKGLNTLQLDFGNFTNGTYILQFNDVTGKLHTTKVVVKD